MKISSDCQNPEKSDSNANPLEEKLPSSNPKQVDSSTISNPKGFQLF